MFFGIGKLFKHLSRAAKALAERQEAEANLCDARAGRETLEGLLSAAQTGADLALAFIDRDRIDRRELRKDRETSKSIDKVVDLFERVLANLYGDLDSNGSISGLDPAKGGVVGSRAFGSDPVLDPVVLDAFAAGAFAGSRPGAPSDGPKVSECPAEFTNHDPDHHRLHAWCDGYRLGLRMMLSKLRDIAGSGAPCCGPSFTPP
jgi:hypothetical protein